MFLYSRLLVILAVWWPVVIMNCIIKSKCSLWFTHTCKRSLISKVKFSVCILLCLVGDNWGHNFLGSPIVSSPSTPPAQCELGKFQASIISVFQWTGVAACKPYCMVTFLEQSKEPLNVKRPCQEPYVQVGRRERIWGCRWVVQRSRRREAWR